MHVRATLVVIAILMVALILVRVFWWRLPSRLRSALFACTMVITGTILFSYAAGWTFVSHRMYALLLWCGVAGYGLLLVRFSLLVPRWLASAAAVILFLPLFSSSIVLPLSNLFSSSHGVSTAAMGDELFSVRTIVDRSPVAPSAADMTIFYRPRWFPFIQHRKATARFFDTQCESSASYAVLQPSRRSVLLACPASPSDPPDTEASGAIVPLR